MTHITMEPFITNPDHVTRVVATDIRDFGSIIWKKYWYICDNELIFITLCGPMWLFLLAWINFNPNMDN